MQIYKSMNQYIPRQISNVVEESVKLYPIVTLTGPRQSGKSTLLKHLFPSYKYISLEDIDMREFARTDPRAFIAAYPDHTIIDEVQRVPDLLSYLQTHTDKKDMPGMYLLSGSQNFQLMSKIHQSLAGRTAVLSLLPLSRKELEEAGKLPDKIKEQIYRGFYPRLYDRDIPPLRFYDDYLKTYVERDIKEIVNIIDMGKFIKFLKLCAGRIGQILNISSLAVDAGISMSTAEGWLSVLESSYICYRLQPYYKNFSKRVIKSPKLYFYDTGLACRLLGMKGAEEVWNSYMKGALFENLIITQFKKDAFNHGEDPSIYYWRDSAGNEIDLLVDNPTGGEAYEIKSSSTFNPDFFKGLEKWGLLAGMNPENLNVIYAGEIGLKTTKGNLISVKNFLDIRKKDIYL